ncbi:MAG: hypothetical protein H6738_01535 [Alphaproteobacteria bacterium]|nr:hypothetical protein [Alphaproteobacteria bacterium]MCB9695450.1 hypothetical protein [Alphaproteobacteria bacterium]
MRPALVAALLAACTTETTPVSDCEGTGPATLSLGEDTTTFVPFEDGDDVPIELSGRYGIWVGLWTTGVDTTDSATLFLRYSLDDDPETTDAGASIQLECVDGGRGVYTVFAPMADELQTADAIATVDGSTLHLTGTIADATGDTATAEVDLTLSTAKVR